MTQPQDFHFTDSDFDDPMWLPVLVEEIGEVAKLLCDIALGQIPERSRRGLLRKELVQVGAMTSAWIDAIDAKNEGEGQ